MKYLFVVQGEGRGHLTQALVLSSILRKNGHEVVGILVGKNKEVKIPAYFFDKAGCSVEAFDSPNLLPVGQGQKVSLIKTVVANFRKSPRFIDSFKYLEKKIEQLEPDVVINFYELIVSLLFEVKRPKVKLVCIAHQYFFLHPHFKFPSPKTAELAAFIYYTKLTCRKADLILALSLGTRPRYNSRKITVVPPLLRDEVKSLQPEQGDFILGYMVDSSFEQQVINWHKMNPLQPLHFFGACNQSELTVQYDSTLSFSTINDRLFLEKLASCRAYACTAGFESICEAMYLGKPVMMVPAHIEQYCNKLDAERAGAGFGATEFQFEHLIDFAKHFSPTPDFKSWADSAEQKIMSALER